MGRRPQHGHPLYSTYAGSRYRLVGDINAFNFTLDNQQRVYIVITAKDYPERLVFDMINQFIPSFKKDCGDKVRWRWLAACSCLRRRAQAARRH